MNSVVPNGWDSKRLGDFASLIMGQSPTSDTYNDEKNGTPFFQGKADFGVKYPKVRYWCTSPTKIAPIDSILFSVRAPVGAVNLNNIEACIGRGLASISGKSIDNTFLYQSLIHAKVKFEALGQGSTFEAINGNELKEFSLVCPPLPEQKKIASILTSVDEVIENTQKQIDKLQDLKKATMNELLTKGIDHIEFKDSELGRIPKSWEVKSVGELYEDTKYLTSDSNEMPLFSLTMEHGLVSKPDRYIRDFLITDTSKDNYKSVRKGELVMNPMNLRWGAISAHYERFDVCVSKYYNVLRGRDDQTSTLFYEALFQSKRFLNLYEKIAIGTLEEKKRVHWSDFQNIKVPVPPMQEQQRMETVIEHFLANISRVMDRNSKYKSLKKSLMQDLLTGKVRVTVN